MSQMNLLHDLAEMERSRLRAPSGDSQRQFKRHVIRVEAKIFPVEDRSHEGAAIEVHLRDVSRGGVGFVCRQELELGSKWRLEFQQNRYAIAEQNIMVRHCGQVRSNLYLCGAQFIASAGLLTLLGVPAADLLAEAEEESPQAFLQPGEVA
jgi:hypothetical protein